MLHVDVLTIFPEMFAPVTGSSILKQAQAKGLVQIDVHNLRDYTHNKRRTVDDRPYGGGPGMVIKPEPIFEAVEAIEATCHSPGPAIGPRPAAVGPRGFIEHVGGMSPHMGRSVRVPPPFLLSQESRGVGLHKPRSHPGCQIVLMAPQGQRLTQALAQELSMLSHLVILCGHYEGVDERIRQALVDREISIGDYVLTGGELPAMVVMDCVVRLIPGVLGHEHATVEESFSAGLLEYPHYTRPPVFRGMAVPEVLRCGNHEQIAIWRKLQALARTLSQRPDLTTPPPGSFAEGEARSFRPSAASGGEPGGGANDRSRIHNASRGA